MPPYSLFGVLLVLTGLGYSATSAANQEAIRLRYSAPAGCPTAREFQRLVFERTRSARPASADETAREFVVTVRNRARTLEGTLAVREADVTFARTVHGANCVEIATVLALATALAIDPRAELDSGFSPPTAAEPLDSDAEAETADAVAPSGRGVGVEPPRSSAPQAQHSPAPIRPARVTDKYEQAPQAARDDAKRPSTPWLLLVSAGPRLVLAATPRPAWGGGLALGAQALGQPLQWIVELSMLQAPDKRVRSAAANFEFLLAAPKLCAMVWPISAQASLGPCVGAELGVVTGRGTDISVQRTARRFWGSATAELKLDLELSARWVASLGAGVGVPFTRYRFEFDSPPTDIYLAPEVVGNAALHLGARF